MSSFVFSQIPAQVLSKVKAPSYGKYGNKPAPKKRVQFDKEEKVKTKSDLEDLVSTGSTVDLEDISVVDLDEPTNEPTSSDQKEQIDDKRPVTPPITKRHKIIRDAIIQTDEKICNDVAVQTDESLMTRPLSMTEDDLHRLNMQLFAPIMAIPRPRRGHEPPLKIGLTLRGRKRKVLYPDDEDYVPPMVCNARGA